MGLISTERYGFLKLLERDVYISREGIFLIKKNGEIGCKHPDPSPESIRTHYDLIKNIKMIEKFIDETAD